MIQMLHRPKNQENDRCFLTNYTQNILYPSLNEGDANLKIEQLLKLRQNEIRALQVQNKELKNQMTELKQQKNKCEEKIIELSNKIFDIERGIMLNLSNQFSQQEEQNTTLDQYSAISIDRYDERQKNKMTLFSKRPSINFQLNDFDARSEQNNEIEELQELNLNFPQRNRHPLKQSLQVYSKQTTHYDAEDYHQFIIDMKKMKLQTERIMKIQNDRLSQKENKRKTFAGVIQRPNLSTNNEGEKEIQRRFKRIRA